MEKIVGKQFGVVASKSLKDSLADSVKEGNQAKFYLAQNNNPNDQEALENVTTVTDYDRNALIINGNTIQGISKNDISKLDAISDAARIFKYQGSLATKELLLQKTPPYVKVGDVYNVESEVTLNNIHYPAHTNFVYTGGNKNTELNWDSLGGAMQMGTSAQPTVKDHVLSYRTNDRMLADSFDIVLGSNTGLVADASGIISIKSDKKTFSGIREDMLSCNSDAPLNNITLRIGTSSGLCIGTDSDNNNYIDLRLATSATCYMDTSAVNRYTNNSLQIVSAGYYPLHEFILPCGNGVEAIITDKINRTANLAVKLSTSVAEAEVADHSRISGLDFNGGGLHVALSSSEGVNKKFLTRNDNGLSLNYTELVNSLRNDTRLKQYINSLIEAKLEAQ